ncbi:MAG: hypothetical protein ACI857_001953 [Arenicella sp.]|jgi:hypothetical protein
MKILKTIFTFILISSSFHGLTQGFDDYTKTAIHKDGITLNIVTESQSVVKTDKGYAYSGNSMLFEARKDGKKVKIELIGTDCNLYRRGNGRLRYAVGSAPSCTNFTITVRNPSTPGGRTTFEFTLTGLNI